MAEQKEKLLRFYKGTEGEKAVTQLVDLAEAVQRTQRPRLSPFLDPFGQEIAETVAANYGGIRVSFDGGYHGAERARAMYMHEDFAGTATNYDIACIAVSWNGQFARLGHRDVLGALMGLGMERDRLGDILLTADTARILCDEKMAEYLLANLTQVGSVGVQCERALLSSITPKEERCKKIRATVASLRIDSIAASGYGCSRSRAAADIEADKLRLNWQHVKSASTAIKEGDVLSMHGRGRIEVAEICGKTKKGRTVILLKRYF
ncbi:MAG: RNA-binding protein [Mitsuokella sp.]